jgi:cobalt-zinc-cadmium efflux system outer membrane protein
MKKIIILTLSLIFIFQYSTFAQVKIELILDEIVKNNANLVYLQKMFESEKYKNEQEYKISDPNIELSYLKSFRNNNDKKYDLSVTQELYFPTFYFHRADLIDLKNNKNEIIFKKELNRLLKHAKLLILNIIYLNSVNYETTLKFNVVKATYNAVETKYKTGKVSIIELNNAKQSLLKVSNELKELEYETEQLNFELSSLNNGIKINIEDTNFPQYLLKEEPDDKIGESSYYLTELKQEVEISKKEIQLSNSLRFPVLNLGYISENENNNKLQGITLGLSLPLWQNNADKNIAEEKYNANKVKLNEEVRVKNDQIKLMESKLKKLKENMQVFAKEFDVTNNLELLKKSFEAGQISIFEFNYELTNYTSLKIDKLKLEYDYLTTFTEIQYFE